MRKEARPRLGGLGEAGAVQATRRRLTWLAKRKKPRPDSSTHVYSLREADYLAEIVNELADPAVFVLIGELLEGCGGN